MASKTIDAEMYDDLVELIYSAVSSPQLWPDVVKKLGAAFKSNLTGFYVQTSNNHIGAYLFDGLDPAMARRSDQHFGSVNPWFTTPNLMLPGRISTDQTLEQLSGDARRFINTEFYNDYCRPADIRHILGSALQDLGGALFNFTFHRPMQDGYFTPQEIHFYSRLSRHLMRASILSQQLGKLTHERQTRDLALDRLRLGVVTLNAQERIEHMNGYARRILAGSNALYEAGARISAKPRRSDEHLQAAIHRAITHRKSSTLNLPRPEGQPLSISVIPCDTQTGLLGTLRQSTTLFISDPDDRVFSRSEMIAARWGLTPREADVAMRLLRGQVSKQIASELGMTYTSAQWYCKQVLQKVGVRRQAELCIKLLSDVSLIIDPTEHT